MPIFMGGCRISMGEILAYCAPEVLSWRAVVRWHSTGFCLKTNHCELLEAMQQLEDRISPRSEPGSQTPWFDTLTGDGAVLLSAPHACRHLRDGRIKMGEEFTASLARYVARLTGNHAIFTLHPSDEDPNWQENSEYKEAIRRLVAEQQIRLVIDLHGMTNRYAMGIAIGTMYGRALHGMDVVSPFLQCGFRRVEAAALDAPLPRGAGRQVSGTGPERHWRTLVVDHPRFTGGVRNHTVTRFVAKQLGVAAVQVEIAAVNRIVYRAATTDWPHAYRGRSEGIAATTAALAALARSI
jgi:hypothetical protein